MSDPLASPRPHLEERKSFAPKQPVELNPPKDDPITLEQLKEADGIHNIYTQILALRLTTARGQVPTLISPFG